METNVYLKNLKTLQRIRDIAGGHSLNLPQICVVGDQSSGKSSVLKLLTGVDFPVNSGTCTKCAIVVECKRVETERFEIQTTDKKEYEHIPIDEVSDKILEVQNSLLEVGKKKISEDEIKVKVFGPKMIDIIVVDLPGIINVGEGRDETRDLIKQYIRPEETLILLVSEAKQDKELVTAVELASEFDSKFERTMHIYTKFDTFDSEESKYRAVQWISEGSNSMLGSHAVVAAPGGKEYNPEEEFQYLDSLKLPDERSGIESLKSRLPSIFAKRIATNLPRLFKIIESKIKADKEELKKIGEEPNNPVMTVKKCQDKLLQYKPLLRSDLSTYVNEFQDSINQLFKKITLDWTAQKFPVDVFVCPFFAGNDAFLQCLIEITEWWKPVLETYTTAVEKVLENFPMSGLKGKVDIPTTLYVKLNSYWNICANRYTDELKTNCDKELMNFNGFGTVNHYLTSKYEGEMYVPEELVEKFIGSVSESDISTTNTTNISATNTFTFSQPKKISDIKDCLQAKLESVRKEFEDNFQKCSLHAQQQKRLHAAVLAIYKVESKTFTDMIFKETQKLMVEVNSWVMNCLLNNEEIIKAANEEKEIVQKRHALKENLEKMEKCMKELSQVM